ncbi:MAG TPA: phosphoribosyltransferase family protein, partial [Anaeromyxobacteraceae bacterium]|nr:phosphoribosyltransferase family protein [Anaeromyxobacteraceae bacterium]
MSMSPDDLKRTGGKPVKAIIYDAPTIQRRVAELGAEIAAAYPSGDLLLVGILKGSVVFLADLIRAIPRPVLMDFLVVSSYGKEKSSSGNVRITYDP